MKQIRHCTLIIGFVFGMICHGQTDGLVITNQHDVKWHITSGSFSNAPYWLLPTNVPYRLIPLKNGQWAWTTNMSIYAIWGGGIGLESDDQKVQQFRLLRRQTMDETDPPGIANVGGYTRRGWNEKHVWNTNVAENWWGVWAEDTNTGWRVNLCLVTHAATDSALKSIIVKVGSVVTNSGAGYLPSPDGKYAKLELLDASGKPVSTKPRAALNLYLTKYAVTKEEDITNNSSPSKWDTSVERNYPDSVSDLEYPRQNIDTTTGIRKGSYFWYAGFVSNGPPCRIGFIRFNDIFAIKTEGDYTLTVQPVLYRMHNAGGTFQGYLDRVDLPSVTTKVHLVPTR